MENFKLNFNPTTTTTTTTGTTTTLATNNNILQQHTVAYKTRIAKFYFTKKKYLL